MVVQDNSDSAGGIRRNLDGTGGSAAAGAAESGADRLKRLKMRSMRRGIKEMDLILSDFASVSLSQMSDDDLALYELLLEENDHDLYQWVSGQRETPAEYLDLITRISDNQSKVHARNR